MESSPRMRAIDHVKPIAVMRANGQMKSKRAVRAKRGVVTRAWDASQPKYETHGTYVSHQHLAIHTDYASQKLDETHRQNASQT